MDTIKKIAKKGNYTKAKIVIALIMAIMIAILYTMRKTTFVIDRIFLVTAILMFVFIHFILKLEKIYHFIYKYRYYIALVAMIVITLCEYSGSSIGVYNEVLQGSSTDTYFTPILGRYRSIRSDEWVVNTPIFISQAIDKVNPFGYHNNNLRGTMTDMFSIISPAVKDILVLGKPFNIGYLLFGAAKGLSIAWYGKWIALALVAFEFCMLITDKKKVVSACGMLLIVFSASSQWWNFSEVMLWGMLALLLADQFLKTDKVKIKIVCSIGIFISAISYVFIMYPAWQISFMIVYIALMISLCIKNRKTYKLRKTDFIYILLVILAIVGMGWRYLNMSQEALQATMNTDYPGSRLEIGGDGAKVLFSYVYSFLFPYIGVDNPCEFAGMISFFPIPILLAVIYLIRNKDRKEHMAFLIPMLIVSVIFSIFTLLQTNEVFAKITLLYMTPGRRLAIPLGFIQILLMVYLLAIMKEDRKIMKDTTAKILAIILSVVIFRIAATTAPTNYLGSLKSYCCGLILVIYLYWLLTMNKEDNKKKLIVGLIGMSIMTGAVVNPVQKGISVLTDKPVAKAVQQIIENDAENNLWILENTYFYLDNYLLASGAKIINSTNIYPNFELYQTVLSEEDYNNPEIRKIYNRYGHLTIEITEDENKVAKIYEDSIKLYMTTDKVKELGIKYIVALRDLTPFETEEVKFEQIYTEEGITIFKAIY